METVKFADLIQKSGGADGRLAVCLMYASSLTFQIKGTGLLVWVTGDDENKQFILDLTDIIPQRDHTVRKNFKVFKQSFINVLVGKGMTNADEPGTTEPEKENGNTDVQETESLVSIPNLSSVIGG